MKCAHLQLHLDPPQDGRGIPISKFLTGLCRCHDQSQPFNSSITYEVSASPGVQEVAALDSIYCAFKQHGQWLVSDRKLCNTGLTTLLHHSIVQGVTCPTKRQRQQLRWHD
ncbi:TPA: hypothetical protein ACH3X1_006652 [Trebouxia sp. C0004]